MRQQLKEHRAVIVAVAAFLAVLWLGCSSESFQSCIQARNNADAEKTFHEGISQFLIAGGILRGCTGYFLSQSGEALTALATIVIALFTWTLWTTSREQGRLTEIAIGDARISSQRELRAYIEAVPEKMALRTDDRTLVVAIRMKNTGKTPAFKVRTVSDLKVWPIPLDQPFRFQGDIAATNKPIPTYVMYPDGEHINAPTYTLTDEDKRHIDREDFGLYVFGRVVYEDTFGDPQWSEFCAYLDKRMFVEWLSRAMESEGRVAVMAGFKFSHLNNDASRT